VRYPQFTVGQLCDAMKSAESADAALDLLDSEIFDTFGIEFKARRDEVDFEKLKRDIRGVVAYLCFGPEQEVTHPSTCPETPSSEEVLDF